MKIKKFKVGDQVLVTAGKDKGRTGQIIKLIHHKDQVVVKGVNLYKKHRKPTAQSAGGIVELERPLYTASIMLVEEGKPIRVGLRRTNNTTTRVSKKSGKTLNVSKDKTI